MMDLMDIAKKLPKEDEEALNSIIKTGIDVKLLTPETIVSRTGITQLAVVLVTKHAQRNKLHADMKTLLDLTDKLSPHAEEVPPIVAEAVLDAFLLMTETFGVRDALRQVIDETALERLMRDEQVN